MKMNFIINIMKTIFTKNIYLPAQTCKSGNRSTLIDNTFMYNIDEIEKHTSPILLNVVTDHTALFTLVDTIAYRSASDIFLGLKLEMIKVYTMTTK